MDPINSILVIVDPTAEIHPAVTKAAQLASKLNARLELYVCDTKAARESRLTAQVGWPSGTSGVTSLKPVIERMAEPLRQGGLDVTTEVDFGDPFCERLVDRIKQTTADLVVKDTHHHSLLKRTFLTNTDWQLIRACPVPLLLTKPTTWSAAPKVFAAVDPGHVNDKPVLLDDRILQYASCFAKHLGGELHALHAYIPVTIIASAVGSEPPMALAVSAEEIKVEQEAKLKEVMQLVGEFGVDASRVHVQLGGPAQLLPHAARQHQADVMVMGALSRRSVKRAFIGSTAEDVLEHLPCDALIVKPLDFADALQGLCA
ncbi:MAG TPA: universal stress protein [Povalibacter sp.]